MIRTIYLHGPLAVLFGKEPMRFKADNIRELLSGITMHHKTFKRELSKFDGLAIMKVRGDEVSFVQQDELALNFGNWNELHLDVNKSGSAEGAAAFAAYVAQAGTTAYYVAYAVAYVAITVAVSYAVSAVMQSLADSPEVGGAGKDKNASTLFNGPENRESQGGRGQLVFGRFECGSYTLSQSIEARRQAIGFGDTISVTEGSTGEINIFSNDAGLVTPEVVSFIVNGGGTNSPGATVSGTGWSVTLLADGTLTFVTSPSSGGTEVVIVANCTTPTNAFQQTIGCASTTNYSWYDSGGGGGGPGDSGNGGSDGDGGTGPGGSAGGDSGNGEGDGGASGVA